MLSFECIKNEKSVYFLLTSAVEGVLVANCPKVWNFLKVNRKEILFGQK